MYEHTSGVTQRSTRRSTRPPRPATACPAAAASLVGGVVFAFVLHAGAGHGDGVGAAAPGGRPAVPPVEHAHLDLDGLRPVGRGAAQALGPQERGRLPAGVVVLAKHRGRVDT